MRTKLLIGIISIFLFFIGFNNYQNFLSFFLGFIPKLVIQYRTLSAQVSQSFFFGLTLSLIPILSLIVWSKFKIQHNRIKIYIILLFLASFIITSSARTLVLKFISQRPFNTVAILKDVNTIEPGNSVYEGESLNYNLYIFVGEILTFIFLYFILKKKSNINRI